MADILHRWQYLIDLLRRQLKGGTPQQTIDATRERIRRIAIDTDQRLVQLTKPGYEDIAFKGLRFGHPGASKLTVMEEDDPFDKRISRKHGALYLDQVALPVVTDPVAMARTLLELERLRANNTRRGRELTAAIQVMRARQGRLLAAKAGGRKYRPNNRGPKIERGPCWDGCGKKAKFAYNPHGVITGTCRFLRGHNKHYMKTIALVERGYERWEDLPDLLKEGLPWGKCIKCKGPIPLVDPYGNPLPPDQHIGFVCWRERMKVKWPYSRKPKA